MASLSNTSHGQSHQGSLEPEPAVLGSFPMNLVTRGLVEEEEVEEGEEGGISRR